MIDAATRPSRTARRSSDTPGPEPGKHTVIFATTPKMSTYLVAHAGRRFRLPRGRGRRTCRSGSAPPPTSSRLTAFALEAAQQQVKFYNRFFGIKYPFGKLDIIGVPDFAAGAMENAGAITFRERYAAGRSAECLARHAQGRRRRHRARDRAPVVRRSGDDEVVGRHLAERGLRHLDGEQAARRVEARVARRARRCGRHADGAGLDALRSTRAIRTQGRDAGRDQRAVRRHRLREDRRGAADDRGLRRPRATAARASRRTCGSTRTATPPAKTSGPKWRASPASRSTGS